MVTKAEKTSEYIIQMVAPIFNKHGYSGTSMSDLTKATSLTKGAIYGNFKNKEELAILAFTYNVQRVVDQIKVHLSQTKSPIQQLYKLTSFYRSYRVFTMENGGCPVINIGVDANHDNMILLVKVREIITRLQRGIAKMILAGIEAGEIKESVDADKYGRYFFTIIEGGVFLMTTMDDDRFLTESMDRIDDIITKELAV
ncbi:MAG: TetR family transcriptional regulator [Fluviicola sp.]|nr:MAG: TetR family transcriptional regulator [Fluviicola sp.]